MTGILVIPSIPSMSGISSISNMPYIAAGIPIMPSMQGTSNGSDILLPVLNIDAATHQKVKCCNSPE